MSKKKEVYQSTDFGIAGIYFEREMAQKKIDQLTEENEKLKQLLAEKEKEIEDYAESLSCAMCKTSELALEITKGKEHIIEFINELAWKDVQYDAFQSTIGDFTGSPLAVPRYAKKYFDLWKEMFKEDLKIEKGEE